jgi:Ca2+-binding EF-hand superfamily protein
MGKLIGLTVEEVEEFFKELDVDGDGGLNMKEIKRRCVGKKELSYAPTILFL